ncbi:hypothetical protein ADK53_28785 [Streptomyces sp. WM6373]|uniref:hypothetical protein n=1 Tax=Streptomyces sp. WM6373 TaxID=1415556 RepID=UPI0006B068C0|nr:hypothetical protein [Streptomyces sp. WM6373]KOU30215.1 hypothetical protein ADK53_28785 [Streptomyces sp. WM6373]
MPRYLISHVSNQRGDILVEDEDLAVHFTSDWVVLTDGHPTQGAAVVLALPAAQVASITRIDEPEE